MIVVDLQGTKGDKGDDGQKGMTGESGLKGGKVTSFFLRGGLYTRCVV